MLTGADQREINEGILQACITGFAKHYFTGDLYYVIDGGNILRTKMELHVSDRLRDTPAPSDAEITEALHHHLPPIFEWLLHPLTKLEVAFQRGKITGVRFMDRSPVRRGEGSEE